MEASRIIPSERSNANSLTQALRVLDEAADTSAEEIKGMVKKDYQKLKTIFQPEMPQAFGKKGMPGEVEPNSTMSNISRQTAKLGQQALNSVDVAAHSSPWPFIGLAAVSSALVGYLLARRAQR